MRRRIILLATAVVVGLSGSQGTATATPAYDGQAAANWALSHAQDPQPDFPGCTWFASLALWAGGMPEDEFWSKNALQRALVQEATGVHAATLAQDLYDHLRTNGSTLVIPLAGHNAQYDRFSPGKNGVPEARLGDLIAYDWQNDGTIDHMAVITHFSPGNYPDVSEWGAARGNGARSDYVYRGWTWSQNAKDWLRNVYPKVVAYLMVIQP